MALIQNFSVPAGDDVQVTFDITGVSLTGSSVEWFVYTQENGVALPSPVEIMKSSAGGTVEIIESPGDQFVVVIDGVDTKPLLGGYFHEATVIDASGKRSTVTQGLMTVLQTFNP